MKAAGISVVVAEAVTPMWYRNAVNEGLPVMNCKDVTKKVSQGDEIEVNLKTGAVKNLTTGATARAEPVPDFLLDVIEAGSLSAYLKKTYKK